MTSDRLDAARDRLRAERRRVVDEREAFEAFRRRTAEVAPATGPAAGSREVPVGHPASGPVGSSDAGATAVRDAYVATVMSVPHYDEEYGEPYRESVEIEFGPELAAALDAGFDARTKRATLAATDRGIDDRERLLAALDEEADSLADARAAIERALEDLADLRAEAETARYGTLDAVRVQLARLADDCDAAAADRQAHVREHHDQLGLPDEYPSIQRYLYADLDAAHPALATLAEVADLVRRERERVERRLARFG
jgi:hypothetical protein